MVTEEVQKIIYFVLNDINCKTSIVNNSKLNFIYIEN